MLRLFHQDWPLDLGEMTGIGQLIDANVFLLRYFLILSLLFLTEVQTITIIVTLLALTSQVGLSPFHLLRYKFGLNDIEAHFLPIPHQSLILV